MLIKVICLFRSLFPIRFVAHMVLFSILGLFSLFSKAMASKSANEERTFLMVKPDGVQRGLIGDIIKRFEQKGFKMVACKFQQVSLYNNTLQIALISTEHSCIHCLDDCHCHM